MNRIKTIDEIEKIVQELHMENKKIVTTNGSFDILHGAHVRLLEQTKALGDVLIVLINNDDSVKMNKGPLRPIIPEQERAYLISELKPVDYVIIFPQQNPLDYLRRIKPHVHVKGGSFLEERIAQEKRLVEEWGGKFVHFPFEVGYSSTDIINKIKSYG